MPRSLAPLLAAACLVALTCAAPALAADGVAAAQPPDELLFTQSSARATLVPTPCRCDGRYVLTLRGADRHTVWFSDRPSRDAGHMPTRSFARGWVGYGFRADPPDAALSAIDASGRRRSDVIELTNPRYDAKRRSMRYVAQAVPYTTGPLKVKRGADGFAPGRLRDVSLFIDDALGTVVDGCLLVSYTKCIAPDLRGVDLAGARLFNVNLPGAQLAGADLSGATLTGATLFGADLTGANLAGASLTYTKLNGAHFTEAELSGADLSSADLTRADLFGATLIRANLPGARLIGAELNYADLTGANLSGTNLTGADFSGASVPGADLTGANLTDVNFRGADWSGSNQTGVRYCRTTMPNGTVINWTLIC